MSTSDTKPRRKRRPWLILIPVILLALVGVAMAIPGSPIYLVKLLEPDVKIDGRSRGEWASDLSAPETEKRLEAAISLGRMNTAGRKALPDLVRVMKTDPDGGVRAAASDAATKMFPANEPDQAVAEYTGVVLEAFTAGLTDGEMRVRNNCAIGLLKLKDKARPAVPALLAASKDPQNDTNMNIYHTTIRQVILRAVGEAAAGTPEAVPTFTAILETKLDRPKRLGNGGRGGAGGGGQATKEESEAEEKYAHGLVDRRIAVTGLGLAGEHGRGSASKIRELLKSDDRDDQVTAKEALERMAVPLEEK